MQTSYQSSVTKVAQPLNIVDTQNQDKFKLALDRLETRILNHISFAIQTDNVLRINEIKKMFQETKQWVK